MILDYDYWYSAHIFFLSFILKRYLTFIFSLNSIFVIFIWIIYKEFHCSLWVLTTSHKLSFFFFESFLDYVVYISIFVSSLNLGKIAITFLFYFQCYGRDTWRCFHFCSVVDYFFFFPLALPPLPPPGLNAYTHFSSFIWFKSCQMCVDGGCCHQFRLEPGEWTLSPYMLRCFLKSKVFFFSL